MATDERATSDDTVRRLQEKLVRAVLLGEPLPGSDQPVRFPDLAFLEQSPEVVIADVNVPEGLAVEDLSRPVVVESEEMILEETSRRGAIAYLRFQPPEVTEDEIRITLEARFLPADAGAESLGLGGVQARFVESPDQGWETVEPPTIYGM